MIKLTVPGRDTFYLADLAHDYGICPKQARKKLRDRFGKLEAHGKHRWAFANADRREVLDIIRRRA